jgi:hypothetical protein
MPNSSRLNITEVVVVVVEEAVTAIWAVVEDPTTTFSRHPHSLEIIEEEEGLEEISLILWLLFKTVLDPTFLWTTRKVQEEMVEVNKVKVDLISNQDWVNGPRSLHWRRMMAALEMNLAGLPGPKVIMVVVVVDSSRAIRAWSLEDLQTSEFIYLFINYS